MKWKKLFIFINETSSKFPWARIKKCKKILDEKPTDINCFANIFHSTLNFFKYDKIFANFGDFLNW